MNTSRIGAEYERAYRHKLEELHLHVARSAASKGPFDLIAYDGTPMHCWHVQLKKGTLSCKAASVLAGDLTVIIPETCRAMVVHMTDESTYCEHVG